MAGGNLLGRIRNHPQPPAFALVITKIILCVLNVPTIVIGAIYLHECPRKHYIPIYLLVCGVVSLFSALLSCLPCARESEAGTSNLPSTIYKAWNLLTVLFLSCWAIAGSVWIYSIYQPNYDKNTSNVDPYCNKTLYLFAFWITTVGYILGGLLLPCTFLVLLCCCLCRRADADDEV